MPALAPGAEACPFAVSAPTACHCSSQPSHMMPFPQRLLVLGDPSVLQKPTGRHEVGPVSRGLCGWETGQGPGCLATHCSHWCPKCSPGRCLGVHTWPGSPGCDTEASVFPLGTELLTEPGVQQEPTPCLCIPRPPVPAVVGQAPLMTTSEGVQPCTLPSCTHPRPSMLISTFVPLASGIEPAPPP